jgi:AcrR family transcriptional regulator
MLMASRAKTDAASTGAASTGAASTGTESRMPLSRERILQAALALADANGIESLSMRKLGDAVGVEAMSLYNHVPSKGDLLDGLIDLVFSEIELPNSADDWKAAMRQRAIAVRAALKRHRWAIGLMESRTSPGPATLRHHDGCRRRASHSTPGSRPRTWRGTSCLSSPQMSIPTSPSSPSSTCSSLATTTPASTSTASTSSSTASTRPCAHADRERAGHPLLVVPASEHVLNPRLRLHHRLAQVLLAAPGSG